MSSEKIGYIKLHRKILENPLWNKRPFDYQGAFIDILLNVNFRPKKCLLGATEYTCEPGQVLYSMQHWAVRWKWSRSKVFRFLDLLRQCKTIDYKTNNQTTLITVLNWDTYQITEKDLNIKRTSNEHQTNIKRTQEKKDKKEKNIYTRFSEIFDFWNSKKIIEHKVSDDFIERANKGIRKRLITYSHDDIILAISNYSSVLKNNACFFKYKWTLIDFLNRENANKFYPDNFIFNNFLTKEEQQKKEEKINPYKYLGSV